MVEALNIEPPGGQVVGPISFWVLPFDEHAVFVKVHGVTGEKFLDELLGLGGCSCGSWGFGFHGEENLGELGVQGVVGFGVEVVEEGGEVCGGAWLGDHGEGEGGFPAFTEGFADGGEGLGADDVGCGEQESSSGGGLQQGEVAFEDGVAGLGDGFAGAEGCVDEHDFVEDDPALLCGGLDDFDVPAVSAQGQSDAAFLLVVDGGGASFPVVFEDEVWGGHGCSGVVVPAGWVYSIVWLYDLVWEWLGATLMSTLRTATIKLAHDVPELRRHLVPVLQRTASGSLGFGAEVDGLVLRWARLTPPERIAALKTLKVSPGYRIDREELLELKDEIEGLDSLPRWALSVVKDFILDYSPDEVLKRFLNLVVMAEMVGHREVRGLVLPRALDHYTKSVKGLR